MAHIIASDAHGLPPRRSPLLTAARDRAAALIGQAAATVASDQPSGGAARPAAQAPAAAPGHAAARLAAAARHVSYIKPRGSVDPLVTPQAAKS